MEWELNLRGTEIVTFMTEVFSVVILIQDIILILHTSDFPEEGFLGKFLKLLLHAFQ